VTLDRQRIDKWLWHARVVRTRTAASALTTAGHVRVNGERVTAASRAVRAGDVITVALDRIVRVMKVVGFSDRRGDAEAARPLYEEVVADRAPPPPAPAHREGGTGRPTKQERRALDRLRRHDEG
jgi:ribosome-associated heat shock protein Hsp15